MSSSGALRAFVALELAGVALLGCSHVSPGAKAFASDVATKCTGALASAASDTVGQAVASLTNAPGAPSWAQFSQGELLTKGIAFAVCVVEQAIAVIDAKVPEAQPVATGGQLQADANVRVFSHAIRTTPVPRALPNNIAIGHARAVDFLEAHGVAHQHGGQQP